MSHFSTEYKNAHLLHKKVCQKWRKAGRPSDPKHPIKIERIQSQRKLQEIIRYEKSVAVMKMHEDIMNSFAEDRNTIYSKLKNIRGENKKQIEIPFIDTLNGRYEGLSVLEGFRKNTEILCNVSKSESESVFSKMCMEDIEIISKLAKYKKYPFLRCHLKLKQFKPNKACDIYMLTVEHLQYVGDEC